MTNLSHLTSKNFINSKIIIRISAGRFCCYIFLYTFVYIIVLCYFHFIILFPNYRNEITITLLVITSVFLLSVLVLFFSLYHSDYPLFFPLSPGDLYCVVQSPVS